MSEEDANMQKEGKEVCLSLSPIGPISQERLSELLTKLLSIDSGDADPSTELSLTAEESRLFSDFVKKEGGQQASITEWVPWWTGKQEGRVNLDIVEVGSEEGKEAWSHRNLNEFIEVKTAAEEEAEVEEEELKDEEEYEDI